ncbi:MAG: SWIM zinc finger family protein [Elainellaceae cyanobacterium]
MAARSHLLYSAAAVRRLLNLPPSASVQIREFFSVLWVWVKGQRPTFVSKAALKKHFVARRQADAQNLQVTDWLQHPPRFSVASQHGNHAYEVICLPDRIECTCHDYQFQVQSLGRGCCKHGYAVLNYLGYPSLQSYLEAQNRGTPRRRRPQRAAAGADQGDRQLELLAS